jgi:hypothetical protein
MKAAEFAGKFLTLNAEGFLMMALVNPDESDEGIQFSGTLAIPLRDAFLVEIPTGWRLVGGVNESGCRLNRSTLTDTIWRRRARRAACATGHFGAERGGGDGKPETAWHRHVRRDPLKVEEK